MNVENLTKEELELIGKEVLAFTDEINELLEGKNMFIIALSVIAIQNVLASCDPPAWSAANAFTKRNQT